MQTNEKRLFLVSARKNCHFAPETFALRACSLEDAERRFMRIYPNYMTVTGIGVAPNQKEGSNHEPAASNQ